MDNPLDFLEDQTDAQPVVETEAQTPVVEATEQAVEAQPAAPARERGSDGKFAPKAAEAPAQAQALPAPDPAHVPLGTLLDEREQRQAAQRRVKELEAAMDAARVPDAPLEPTQVLETALYNQKLDISRALAEQKYGPDIVQQVHDWVVAKCDADPAFNQQMRSSRLPYEAAFQAFNTDRILQTVKPEQLDAFLAWQTAQAEAQAQQPQTQQPADANLPPRSLVSAPGNGLLGKNQPQMDDQSIFESVIK